MPYGSVTVEHVGRKIVIVIDPPDHGEPSASGRTENLVDPRRWIRHNSSDDQLVVKMTVCRPYNGSFQPRGR
jgi:hypothetical protein